MACKWQSLVCLVKLKSPVKAQDSRGWSLEATEAESNQKPSLLHTNWPGFRKYGQSHPPGLENTVEVARTPMPKLSIRRGGHCMQKNPKGQGQTDHGECRAFKTSRCWCLPHHEFWRRPKLCCRSLASTLLKACLCPPTS